jgi:hypothetical protein
MEANVFKAARNAIEDSGGQMLLKAVNIGMTTG